MVMWCCDGVFLAELRVALLSLLSWMFAIQAGRPLPDFEAKPGHQASMAVRQQWPALWIHFAWVLFTIHKVLRTDLMSQSTSF